MKKMTVGILLFMFFAFQGVSFAMTPEDVRQAHFKEIKEIKEKQRQEKQAMKNNPPASVKKAPGFWEKEGERSGLGGTGSRTSQFFKNLNPVPFFKEQRERYDARKAGAVK